MHKKPIMTIRIAAALALAVFFLASSPAARAADDSDTCIVHRSGNSSFRLCQSGFRNESYAVRSPYEYSRSVTFVPVRRETPGHGNRHKGHDCKGHGKEHGKEHGKGHGKGKGHGHDHDDDFDRDHGYYYGRFYRQEEAHRDEYYVIVPAPVSVARRVIFWP